MHIRCPHCQNPIEDVQESSFDEIVCPACGSNFSLISETTVSYVAKETRRIAHFELIESLGVGAFGNVWKARDTKLDRIVAVKIPRDDRLSPAEKELFLREARAAAQLNHPNIVAVHEVGREDETIYIVSDFVPGLPLSSWLTGQRPTQREAAELAAKIAEALHHAHEAGIVHRDLKPSNVILDVDGEPHILDFGLAKREVGEITMTVDGKILGTPAYMSPEQATGKGHQADRRADVYSLGVILFELLTGELPFRGDRHMLIHQVVTEVPPSPRKYNNRTAKDLETICLRCLEKNPDRRFQTAKDVADDLRRWLNNEPIKARPVGRVERTVRWCQRNRAVTAFIVLLVVALLGLVAGTVSIVRAQRERTLARIDTLLNAEATAVPSILENLRSSHSTVAPRLHELSQQALPPEQRWRVSVALLPEDDRQVEFLRYYLLQAAPTELKVIRDELYDHRASLVGDFWTSLGNEKEDVDRRFRAACVLALYAPEEKQWIEVSTFVADHLVDLDASTLVVCREVLSPAKGQLIEPLKSIYQDSKRDRQHRIYAAETLADYAADRADVLFDLLADAEQFQFPILFRTLAAHEEKAVAFAQFELAKQTEDKASEDEKEALAKRQANAVVALYRMGRADQVWPKLKFGPDPRVRSYVIHWLSSLGGNPQMIIDRLDVEPGVTIRRALVLTLGEFTDTQLPADQREPLVEKLLVIYENEPDAGLHSATEWLLKKWGKSEQLQAVADRLKTNEEGVQARSAPDKRQWYINTQGQTFVIVDASKSSMGSVGSEPHQEANGVLHRRHIGRRFAISTKEVTEEQFLRFRTEFSHNEMHRRYPEPGCPIVGMTWYEAAEYCNWLSKQEGIPTDQWCYEANEHGRYAEGMKIRENYLALLGYRLPTETEWESACRSGTLTSRYYGWTKALLPQYAWYLSNSENRPWPVGSLKPNEWGLFDMYGNVFEWCQGTYQTYANSLTEMAQHNIDVQRVTNSDLRVLRGRAFDHLPANVHSGNRHAIEPDDRNINVGFRPARTYR